MNAMTAFPIDKDIPIPGYGVRGPQAKYPWAALGVGDSFYVQTEKPQNFIRNVYAKNRDRKHFVARKVDGGVRVWRTA